jgi:hypothetical protein
MRRLAQQLVIITVRADPEPHYPIREAVRIDADNAVVQTNTPRPEASDLLQLKRRVPRVAFSSLYFSSASS